MATGADMSGTSGPGGGGTGDIPQRLGKYEIKRALGRGAMGIVYEAFDPVIERRVAIKTVILDASDDPETAEGLERFKREAQAAGRLTHPNIVGVYDYGETDSLAYIVMEFVEGDTLKSLLDRGERFALADTAALMRALLDGLAYSHAQGVIHRDIKPANVMVTADKRVKLADFGVARIESSSLTQAGTMIGTPAYMSPEQFMGQPIDARSDIYSTGVLLYQLLTGEKPFEGSLTSIMHKVLNTEPPRPSALAVSATPALDAVVAQAMAKRPDDRFASAAAFAEALDAALSTGTPDAADAADLGEATLVAPPRGASAEAASESTQVSAAQVSAAQKPPAPKPGAAPSPAGAPQPSSRSSRTPLLAGVGVLALLVAGGGAWLATRGPAPHHPAGTQHAASGTAPSAAGKPAKTTAPKTATSRESSPPSGSAKPPAKGTTTAAQTQTQPTPARTSASASTSAPASTSTPSTQPSHASATPKPAPSNQATAPATPSAEASKTPPASGGTTSAASKPGSTPAAGNQTKVATNAAPASPKPPAIPTNAAIRAHVASAVQSVPCALLHGSITGQGQGKSVRLAGFVGSTERSALKSALASPPVPVSTTIRGFTGPYCGLISAIRPFSGLFQDTGTQPGGQLSLGLAHGATKLTAGQLIVIHLGLPDFPAYLQVDYVSSNGSIYPLYPGNAGKKAPLSPGQTLVLGSPKTKGGPRWAVGAPFGRDMILAIAASKPIGAAPDANATVGSFLPRLRQALDTLKQNGAETSTAGVLLDTVSK